VREFLYCHGQAGTVKKFTGVSVYPANYAPPRAAKIGQSQAKATRKNKRIELRVKARASN
jgi:hypothetical protein